MYAVLALVLVVSLGSTYAETNLVKEWFNREIRPATVSYFWPILEDQTCYSGVKFYSIDTFSVSNTVPWSPEPVFRIAVDKSLNVYKLYGFDTLEFSSMCRSNPAAVDTNNTESISKLFITLQKPSTKDSLVFVRDIEEFMALQDKLSQNKGKHDHQNLSMKDVESDFRFLLDSLKCHPSTTQLDVRHFLVEQLVWFYNTGELKSFKLRIDEVGNCEALGEIVVARRFGFWRNVH
jgi:hypothetical protein